MRTYGGWSYITRRYALQPNIEYKVPQERASGTAPEPGRGTPHTPVATTSSTHPDARCRSTRSGRRPPERPPRPRGAGPRARLCALRRAAAHQHAGRAAVAGAGASGATAYCPALFYRCPDSESFAWVIDQLKAPTGLATAATQKGFQFCGQFNDTASSSVVLYERWDSQEDQMAYMGSASQMALYGGMVERGVTVDEEVREVRVLAEIQIQIHPSL